MQKLTRKGLQNVIMFLEEEFETVVSDVKFNMYLELLQDVTDEQLMLGIVKLLRDRKYNQHKFPKVSEIREFIFGDKKELLEEKSEIAKGLVFEAIRKAGAYKSVCFDDPVIHAVIKNRLGGWITLCKMEKEDFDNFMKFEFSKAYNALASQGIGLVDKVLLGRADRKNDGKYEVEMIEYFGKKEKVEKWQCKLEKKIEETGIKQLELKNKSVKF